jgi:hypothetical protein
VLGYETFLQKLKNLENLRTLIILFKETIFAGSSELASYYIFKVEISVVEFRVANWEKLPTVSPHPPNI